LREPSRPGWVCGSIGQPPNRGEWDALHSPAPVYREHGDRVSAAAELCIGCACLHPAATVPRRAPQG
jgi:hypothetical protein